MVIWWVRPMVKRSWRGMYGNLFVIGTYYKCYNQKLENVIGNNRIYILLQYLKYDANIL